MKELTIESLECKIKELKSENKKIIFTNGCFDILHKGHIFYLKESKKLGDILIVGLNSDESIKKLKGEFRPINNQEDRSSILSLLKCVNFIVIFNEDTPYELIKLIMPDIITKGDDYNKNDVIGGDLSEVVTIPILKGYSTTNIINKRF